MRNNGTKKKQVRPCGSRHSSLIPDEIHTAQVPCCELVKEVTADVVPEAFEAPVPAAPERPCSSSLFGTLLRNHLIEQRHSHPTIESLAKKKRKRKKKKKPTDTSAPLDQEPEEDQSEPASPSNNEATVPTTEARAHKSSKNTEIVVSWIDRLVQQGAKGTQIDKRCLPSFMDSIATSSPAISIDEISKDLSRVSCSRCRTQVEAYWQSTGIPAHELGIISGTGENMNNRRMYLHPRMISPSRWTLPLAGIDDDRYERAFDYVPLEEGYGANEETDGEAWLMQSTIDRATTRPMELVMQRPFDLHGVERLTRDLILPCGLPEMEDPDAYILTDQQFHDILTRQRDLELPISTRLRDMKVQKDDILEKLRMDETSSWPSEDFNLKFGHTMRDMDQQCESLLGDWLELLLLLTKHYGGIVPLGWATDKIAHFWAAYSEGVNNIIRESLNHEAVLIRISSSSGVIKQMFLDASHRNSYRQLIQEKSRAVFAIHDEIFDYIVQEDEEEGEASFLKTLLTYESFSFVTSNESTAAKSGLDLTCESLLKAWTECSVTVHCPNSKTLLTTQEERTNMLSELLTQVSTTLEEEYVILEDRLRPQDISQWKDMRHRYKESSMEPALRENPDDEDDGSYARNLAERRKRLGCMTGIAVSQWLYIREMQRTTSITNKATIPIRLKEWMIAAERRDHLTLPGNQDCMGNGGKRRLACIIASLYYKWLVARCDEWHADLIHTELLEDATFVLHPAEETGDAKLKPATKKKRKKKAVVSVATAAPVTLEREGKDVTLVDEMQAGLGVGKNMKAGVAPSKATSSINDASSAKRNESVEDIVAASMDRIGSEAWTPVKIIKKESPEESKSAIVPDHLPGQTEAEETNLTEDGVGDSIQEDVRLDLAVEINGLSVNSVEEVSSLMGTDMQADATMGNNDGSSALTPQREGRIEDCTDSFTIESYEEGIEIEKVGVTGRNGFKLAETYLVSRLDALLENGEKSKSSFKVVFA
jgi:hypothetical protein